MRYKVTISTDPYHGSRSLGFKLNHNRTLAYKIIDEFDDYDQAVKCLLNEYSKVFDTYVKSYEEMKDDALQYQTVDRNVGRFSDGSCYFSYDVFNYDLIIIDKDE